MKTSKKLILLGFAICLFWSGQALATEYWVSGVLDNYFFGTIQQAVNQATDGDIIHIMGTDYEHMGVSGIGTYIEAVDVGTLNNITFVGEGTDVVVTDPGKGTNLGFDVDGDGVSFSNMTISGFLVGINGPATNLSVSNVTFDGNDMGVSLSGTPFDIADCDFVGNTVGIQASDDGTISGCTFAGSGAGIDAAGGDITGCSFAVDGLSINKAGNGNITDGIFTGSGPGIAMVGNGDITGGSMTGGSGAAIDLTGDGNIAVGSITGTGAGIVMVGTGNISCDIAVDGLAISKTGDGNITGGSFTGSGPGIVMVGNGNITGGTFTGGSGTAISFNGNGEISGHTIDGGGKGNTVGIEIVGGVVDVYGNDVQGASAEGIVVSGDASGYIHDNNVQYNGVGIDVDFTCTSNLYVYGNCLDNNTTTAYDDDNAWATTNVRWYRSGVGNYYPEYVITDPYFIIPGGDNRGYYALTATNNPSAPAQVPWGDNFTIDMVYTMPVCDPVPNLKTCHFKVTYDPTLVEFVPPVTDGGFLPNIQIVYNDGTPGELQIDLTALGDGNYSTDPSGTLVQIEMVALQLVGTTAIDVESEYIDADGLPIPTRSTPINVEVIDNTPPEIVETRAGTYLSGSPTGDNTFSAAYPIELNWEVVDDYDLKHFYYRIWDATCTSNYGWVLIKNWSGCCQYTDSDVETIDVTSLGSGDYQLQLLLRDHADLEDNWDCVTRGTALPFTVDNTPPDPPAFSMEDADGCADPGWFGPGDGIRILSAETEPQMEFSFGSGGIGAIAYSADYVLDVSTSPAYPYTDDGTVDVWMRLIDVYGNIGGWTGPQGIDWSNTAPDPNFIYLGKQVEFNVPAKTKSLTFNGSVYHWGDYGSTEFAWNVNGDPPNTCEDAAWQTKLPLSGPPARTYFPITIPGTKDVTPDGDYTIGLVIRDAAGNVSTEMTDVITLDRTAPQFTDYEVNSNGKSDWPCDDDWNVDIHMEFEGDAYAVRPYPAGTSQLPFYPWIVVSPPGATSMDISFTILSGDRHPNALNTINCKIKDALGNLGDEESDDVFIDRTNPSASGIALSDLDGVTLHADWTDDATVLVTVGSPASDITKVRMAESLVDLPSASWLDFNPAVGTIEYTFATTECVQSYLYLEVADCSGRKGGPYSDWIRLDLTDPVVSAVAIKDPSNPPKTKSLTNTVYITASDNCLGGVPWKMMVSEDPTFMDGGLGDNTWQPFNATPSHTFGNYPDGEYCIYVRVADPAGRMADGSDCIILDRTKPSGVMTIVAPPSKSGGCPGAAPGYTCTLENNILEFTDVSEDAVKMKIRNCAPSMETAWLDVAASYVWPLLHGSSPGQRCVEVKFKDDANNVCNWIQATIIYDNSPPTWPGGATFTAVPSDGEGEKDGYGYAHAIDLSWTGPSDAQYYGLNWQWAPDYPEYEQSFPTPPGTHDAPWVYDDAISGTSTTFITPGEPGIYIMALWVQDSAGHWSTTALADTSQDYFGGDWGGTEGGPDGEMNMSEWSSLAMSFYSTKAKDDNYNDSCDIGPTNTDWIDGYTLHDDEINFDDLVIFTFNYDLHAAGARAVPGLHELKPTPGQMAVTAEIPRSFAGGDRFDAVIRFNEPAGVKCMSFTFEYDMEQLEALSITPGDMFDGSSSFLLNRINGSSINLDGTILGSENQFENSEVAVIRFRARTGGSFEFAEPLMDVRSHSNERIEVAFSNVYAAPPEALPTAFALAQNYPNPFNPTTNIDLSLPVACNWRVNIYNIAGQLVTSFTGFDEPGRITIRWDGVDAGGSSVASGIYFYKAIADEGRFIQTRKMVLMK